MFMRLRAKRERFAIFKYLQACNNALCIDQIFYLQDKPSWLSQDSVTHTSSHTFHILALSSYTVNSAE